MDTLFVGQNVIHLEQIDSTNSYLQNLIVQKSIPEGTCVTTTQQTQGRGQRGNTWLSEPGQNLTFSLVLYPRFLKAIEQFYLSKIVALSLREAVEIITGQKALVKWPNDILVNDKKIAGILIENTVHNQYLNASVIGIGLNVNQTQFPTELNNITSIQLENQQKSDINSCLSTICKNIEAWYMLLKAGKIEEIDKNYLQNLYLLEQWANFIVKNERIPLKIKGINPLGLLLTQTVDGMEQQFDLKEIAFADSA